MSRIREKNKTNIKKDKKSCFIEKIYKDNYTYFYNIAYSILKNKEEAEDVVTETFIKIYKYIDKLLDKKNSEIVSYCVSIVKSISYDVIKDRSKIVTTKFSEEIINLQNFSNVAMENELAEINKEKLFEILDVLNDIEVDIFEFRSIDGLTYKVISAKIGISEEAVRKRYQRLIKKLQKKGGYTNE